jgi:lipooligosaccharide transport system permease protein
MTVTVLAPAARVLQRNLWVYRRTWRGSVFGSFTTPLLYLTAMGIGLGSLIQAEGRDVLGGYPYLHFLGPGILAASCMQSASFEASFPILGKIQWRRNYEAILATPLGVRHILLGELLWVGFRMTQISSVFLLVLTLFGIPTSPLALLAIPCAILTGLAFSTAIMSFTATQRTGEGFSWIFRFVINPLFLFSGTFFPLDQLPPAAIWLAAATPLYHGVALIRGVILGDASLLGIWYLHVTYLVVFLSVFSWLAHRLLKRRLQA